jgi:hypothetical protein
VGEFATLLKSYGVSQISGDRFANVWPVEAFGKVNIFYEQNAELNSTLNTNMLPLLKAAASSCWTSRARSPSYAALSGAPRASEFLTLIQYGRSSAGYRLNENWGENHRGDYRAPDDWQRRTVRAAVGARDQARRLPVHLPSRVPAK